MADGTARPCVTLQQLPRSPTMFQPLASVEFLRSATGWTKQVLRASPFHKELRTGPTAEVFRGVLKVRIPERQNGIRVPGVHSIVHPANCLVRANTWR